MGEFKNIDVIKASKYYTKLKREIDEAKILDRDYSVAMTV